MKQADLIPPASRLATAFRLLKQGVTALQRFFASRTGLVVQIIISALLLLWLAKALDARTWTAMRELGVQTLVLVTLVFSTSQIFSGLRLACLLNRPHPWRVAIVSTFAGFFWSTFLPGTVGGDVVRVAKLHAARIEITRATGAIVFDRLLNTMGIAVILALSSAGLIAEWAQANVSTFLALAALAVIGAVGTFLAARVLARRQLPELLAQFLAPIHQLLARPGLLLAVALLTLCNIGSSILAQWLLSSMLGLEVSVVTLISIICLVTIATMLPISLNGIGLQEVSFFYLLTLAGAAPEKAVIFSLLVRAIIVGTSLIAGLAMIVNRVIAPPPPPPAG